MAEKQLLLDTIAALTQQVANMSKMLESVQEMICILAVSVSAQKPEVMSVIKRNVIQHSTGEDEKAAVSTSNPAAPAPAPSSLLFTENAPFVPAALPSASRTPKRKSVPASLPKRTASEIRTPTRPMTPSSKRKTGKAPVVDLDDSVRSSRALEWEEILEWDDVEGL
jgi:hypothetical protein